MKTRVSYKFYKEVFALFNKLGEPKELNLFKIPKYFGFYGRNPYYILIFHKNEARLAIIIC